MEVWLACVVVEDSPFGVTAARAAGMRVLGYAATTPPDELAEADAVFTAMAEQRVLGRLADLLQNLPAARTFRAVSQDRRHADARHVGQPEVGRRGLALDQLAARGDADLGEVETLNGL